MKKLANFLVDKRIIIFTILMIITGICLPLMSRVKVNYNMAEYLPEDSNMKQGMRLMNEEFGEAEQSDFRLMFPDLTDTDKQEIYDYLSSLDYVSEVKWDNSGAYDKDGYTLFVLTLPYENHSKEVEKVYNSVTEKYADREMYTGGTVKDGMVPLLPISIVIIAVALATVVLLAMSNSWFEPVVFLTNIGVAVAINIGTNVFFSSVSEYTKQIVGVMQMVLSMDYSIILLNRYTQEKEKNPDRPAAMKTAIMAAFPACTGSSLTTFVGLLAMLFMSFTIGADMGIAMAKSVMISLICIFTVLPTLILKSDKLIEKTKKKALHIPMGKYSALSNRHRIVFAILFIALFAGAFYMKSKTEILYTLDRNEKVDKVFLKDNTIVVLYEKKDSANVEKVFAGLEYDEKVTDISGYYNTLGKKYTADEIAELLGDKTSLDPSLIKLVYTDRFADISSYKVTLKDMLTFFMELAKSGNLPYDIDQEMLAQLDTLAVFTDPEAINVPHTAEEISAIVGMDSNSINMMFTLTGNKELSLKAFIDIVADNFLSNPAFSSFIDEDTAEKINIVRNIMSLAGKELSQAEFLESFGSLSELLDKDTVSLLFLYYVSQNDYDESYAMTPSELADFITDDVLNDPRFAQFITPEIKLQVGGMRVMLLENAKQLEGEKYGRVIVTSKYPDDSAETRVFVADLIERCKENLSGNYYLIGSSAMNYEMSKTFNSELNKITLITAIAIFVVVAVTFRSLVIPLILVLIVQCGVYMTMTFIGLSGNGMYFIALLIVQCILMGATIDYGILFTTYYRENRKNMEPKEAVQKSYDGSLQTILTSSLIMVLVTGALSFVFKNPAIGEICLTISRGALCATILIVFILPGILAFTDRFIRIKTKE
ncbi:MAG: MMPL family transporter [Lachnospiraceae bacterium]|nr:MMPL family transporter [Lachnospiraceae bacterium]